MKPSHLHEAVFSAYTRKAEVKKTGCIYILCNNLKPNFVALCLFIFLVIS